MGSSRTQRQYDSVRKIVDRLTKSAHFIHIKYTYSAEDYARIFIDKIECCHVILFSIMSDWGAEFIFRFWMSFQEGLGT